MWRRPVELHHAYIWVEEGTVSLPAYLSTGWRSVFSPVSGYLVVPAKLIFLTAATLSATHLPQVEYWLTLIFEVGTIALIAFSPSHLPFPKLAALSVMLVPTQPEVFAVSEYAFWWGALWSFVAVFWRDGDHPRLGWRGLLVLIGGLSSPMCIPAAGLLVYRAIVTRKRTDWLLGVGAVLVGLVQLVFMLSRGPMGDGDRRFDPFQIVLRFFGQFVVSSEVIPALLVFTLGAAILVGLVAYCVANRKWRDPYFVMLVGCLCAALLASITRVPVHVLHPVLSGPRYFFYPFVFLAWTLLYMFAEVRQVAKVAIGGVLLVALTQFAHHGRQRYDTFTWRAELQRCVASGSATYSFPVQFAGPKEIAWHVPLTGDQCQDLIDRSIFK